MPDLTSPWTLHWDLFFSPDRPFALSLNLVIAALALSAIGVVARVMFRALPREKAVVAKVRRVTPITRGGVEAAVVGSRTIVEARVQDLRDLSLSSSRVDPAAISGLSAMAMRSQLQVPTGIGRSLIVLGLLGTLWGLGTAVTTLAGTLSPPQVDGALPVGTLNTGALAQAILDTLGGMQTAFGTTLAGITGFLLVALAVGVARRSQGRTFSEMERLLATTLVPLYDTSEASRLTAAAGALEGMERRVAEDMRGILSAIEREGRALGERLEEEFNGIEEAFRQRSEDLIRATGRAMESTLSIIGERGEGEPTLAEYVRTVRTTVEGLQTATESAAGLIPGLERSLMASLETHRARLDEVLAEHRHEMAPLVRQQAVAAELLAASAKDNATRSDELASVLHRFADSVQVAQETWARTDQLIYDVGRSCREGIETGLRTVTEEVRSEQRHGSAEREAVARHLVKFGEQLNQHLDRMLADRQAVVRQMTELLEAIRDTTGTAVREVGEALEGRGDANAYELRVAIERLARELRDLVITRGGNSLLNS